jgi:hypothetical protein
MKVILMKKSNSENGVKNGFHKLLYLLWECGGEDDLLVKSLHKKQFLQHERVQDQEPNGKNGIENGAIELHMGQNNFRFEIYK